MMHTSNNDPSRAAALTAGAVHREQVWAALIRAVDLLLEESLWHLEDDIGRADRNDDIERTERLLARARVLTELRRQVTSPPH